MKITKKTIILLAFSVILMVLGLWNYADANPVTYDVIASSVVLVVVGWTLALSVFERSWTKAALFFDGLVFIAVGIAFLLSPYNYIFMLFGLIILVVSILAYLNKLPISL
ncbi:hypothetical protein [uncultured Methanobrevibacter sp.]|uniref:hypothetical protein n=1 Tax=uncultured Methanobrevibacter sp. TaxID=253161 RepID=UPI0026294164